MPANTPRDSPSVLWEETQLQTAPCEEFRSVLFKSPWVAAVALDYVLFLEYGKTPRLSRRNGLSPMKWEKIVPADRLLPFEANLVSFTWTQFQTNALIHVADNCQNLRDFLLKNHDDGKLVWLAHILNHPNYGVAVKINGPMDFVNFSNAAYDAFPATVGFKITMDNSTVLAYEVALRAQVRDVSATEYMSQYLSCTK
ncbi:hypothetical protein PGT21_018317 [Puccinia graminis f. sp. tritici]|uniref:Uncharacterized protein n=1 Tax=Puccinia graminis f. sp. tritici TaxID=56615 RepID=A0A5B0MWU6_PUCGR|nr:hypothetical protein PGT21_018317 [Puccinia graminis f. sp. tritici]KAA1092079.1 hypothetical protein PGTUg99_014494 [Puccinia graminis f. sp. tritici]